VVLVLTTHIQDMPRRVGTEKGKADIVDFFLVQIWEWAWMGYGPAHHERAAKVEHAYKVK